jgi:hypothetical protein
MRSRRKREMSGGSESPHLRLRDTGIGWADEQRRRRLALVANNVRFLLLPDRTLPNRGSAVLSRVLAQLSDHWEARYEHPVLMVETYIAPFQTTRPTAISYVIRIKFLLWKEELTGCTLSRAHRWGARHQHGREDFWPALESSLRPLDRSIYQTISNGCFIRIKYRTVLSGIEGVVCVCGRRGGRADLGLHWRAGESLGKSGGARWLTATSNH